MWTLATGPLRGARACELASLPRPAALRPEPRSPFQLSISDAPTRAQTDRRSTSRLLAARRVTGEPCPGQAPTARMGGRATSCKLTLALHRYITFTFTFSHLGLGSGVWGEGGRGGVLMSWRLGPLGLGSRPLYGFGRPNAPTPGARRATRRPVQRSRVQRSRRSELRRPEYQSTRVQTPDPGAQGPGPREMGDGGWGMGDGDCGWRIAGGGRVI